MQEDGGSLSKVRSFPSCLLVKERGCINSVDHLLSPSPSLPLHSLPTDAGTTNIPNYIIDGWMSAAWWTVHAHRPFVQLVIVYRHIGVVFTHTYTQCTHTHTCTHSYTHTHTHHTHHTQRRNLQQDYIGASNAEVSDSKPIRSMEVPNATVVLASQRKPSYYTIKMN